MLLEKRNDRNHYRKTFLPKDAPKGADADMSLM